MRTLAVLFVVVGALVAAAARPVVAAADQWQIHLTAAGRVAARAAVVKRADLGAASGWKGGSKKPDLSTLSCPNFHPKQSDLVVIGAAESEWDNNGMEVFVSSGANVLQTAEMVRLDWQRSELAPQVLPCLRSGLTKQLGASQRLVSFRRITFPRLATYTHGFRALVDDKSSGKRVRAMVDYLAIGHGRTEISLQTEALFSAKADVVAFEIRLAHLLVARAAGAGLELAALPPGVLPKTSVDHLHGAVSDIAAASPGIVAAYTRIFTYPDAKNPPYEFVDEEILAAATPAAAAKAFAKLERDTHTRSGLASLESVIGDMYMATVFLPVSSSPGRRLTPQLGDDATEILFNAHSSCCTFEAAVVIIRVRTAVAIIYAGGVNTLNHAQLARLFAQAASRLAGAT